jgi:hypothetical protein
MCQRGDPAWVLKQVQRDSETLLAFDRLKWLFFVNVAVQAKLIVFSALIMPIKARLV